MARISSKNKSKADMWLVALVACFAILAIVIMSKGIGFAKPSYSYDAITGEVVMDLSGSCADSDSGLDYYDAGSISGSMPKKFDAYDRCISKTILWETYCNSDNYGSAVQFTCPLGCEANRCKED